jgi:hypothetical protein
LDIDENADFDFVWDLREWEMKGNEWSKMKSTRKWLVYCYLHENWFEGEGKEDRKNGLLRPADEQHF